MEDHVSKKERTAASMQIDFTNERWLRAAIESAERDGDESLKYLRECLLRIATPPASHGGKPPRF